MSSWKVLSSRYSYSDNWVRVRSDKVELPDGSVLDPYHIVEYADCVIAIALTSELDVLMIEQYRHGAKRRLLEFPAGAVEVGESNLAAARRELREETGYSSADWHYIGSTFAGAGRLSNQYHGFLALDAYPAAEPQNDAGEHLNVSRIPWAEFVRRLGAGELTLAEAGDVAALFQLQLLGGRSADARIAKLCLPFVRQ